MIFTSKYTNLTAPTAGRGKRGFFALGEAAQKKLYTAEHVPSSPGEPGLFFPLLPLPHAAAGIPPSLPGVAHSAEVGGGHHCTIDTSQISHRVAVWAALRCSFRSATGFRPHNRLKPFIKTNYGPKGQPSTREEGSC
jgi:hypothetical protein